MISIGSGDTVETILACLEDRDVKPGEARFEMNESYEYNDWGERNFYSEGCVVQYEEPESDKQWETRLVTYRKRLATWEEWADQHAEEIEAHLAALATEKEAKLVRLAERSRKSLEKERETLEKRLENVEKRLQK